MINEIINTIFNIELPNFMNSTKINKNINILKNNCINFIISSPY
jgi:hypothetical protein